MRKINRVKNNKRTPRLFTPLAHVDDYIASLERKGERTMMMWKERGERHEMSYSRFVQLVKELSTGLRILFEDKQETVAIVADKSPYWLISYVATIAAGCIVLPMDKELDPSEIKSFFNIANAKAVVYSPNFSSVFEGMIAEGHDTLRYLIPIDPDSDCETSFKSLYKKGRASGREFVADRDRERCCEYLFTSGTTGTSKCVMLCQRNIFTALTVACETVDVNPDDVLVSVLPLHHTYELACTLAGFNYGCKIGINESVRHIMKDFQEYQPTTMVLVPLFVTTMYKKIMSEAKKSKKDKILRAFAKVSHYLEFAGIDMSETVFRDVRAAFGGRLEKIVCGGAALNPEMINVFESFGISIYEGYGITECSPLVCVTPYYDRRPGSVGKPVPCNEVRIDGTEVNEYGFEVGEIQVKGDNVMLGYMDPEATAATFTDDGWFKTGDVGYMDNEGFVFITGRSKSVIVLENGKNVFPEEIEEYLGEVEMIAESVVVGRTEDQDGTVSLTAVIFPAYDKFPNMTEADFRAAIQKEITAINKRLPSFKQIRRLEFRQVEFEKTSSRKIKRHLVK